MSHNFTNFTKIDREKLNLLLNRLVTVNPEGLQIKFEQAQNQNHQNLASLLDYNDDDIKQYLTQYCYKSGKPLRKLALEQVQILINIHGRQKAIELLKLESIHQYAPEWLHTEPASLNKLQHFDPLGYFVYAASHIFHDEQLQLGYYDKKTVNSYQAKSTTSPQDALFENNSEWLKEFGELSPDCKMIKEEINSSNSSNSDNKVLDKSLYPIPVFISDCNWKLENLHDKARCYQQLKLLQNNYKNFNLLLLEINELLRKFLSLVKPVNAGNLIILHELSLTAQTNSILELYNFKQVLKLALKQLFLKHWKQKQKNRKELALKEFYQKNKLIGYSDIEDIKYKYGGNNLFFNQASIGKPSKVEAILYDLRNFWDTEIQDSQLKKTLAAIGNSKNFDTKQAANQKTVLKVVKVSKGFRFTKT